MQALHHLVELLTGGHGHGHDQNHDHDSAVCPDIVVGMEHHAPTLPKTSTDSLPDANTNESDWGLMTLPCCDEDPKNQWDTYQQMAKKMIEYEKVKEERDLCIQAGVPERALEAAHSKFVELSEEEHKKKEKDRITRMGYKTAFAVALHNFPEGLATFVAALEDPRAGVVLAIAIAIHNIPEGLCVALPLYFATGNRQRAFMWGCLSGVSEPIAGLLGWAVLANNVSDVMYAVLFGIVCKLSFACIFHVATLFHIVNVTLSLLPWSSSNIEIPPAGMMVLISIRELLPTAHRYDPEDKYVTYSFTIGMSVMALSLALIAIS